MPFRIGELTGRGLALAVLGLIASSAASAATFDVILRHGTVIDGSGEPRFRADVALSNGVIVRIGDLHRDHGRLDLDVTGLFITPGFINPHSHADADAVGVATNMLTQGVTTEFVNPDGQGPLDIRAQLNAYAASGLAINLGAYVGFNSIWESVMGTSDHRATPDDVARMRALLTQNLERGAWGVSAGLDYKPGYFATTDEVIAVLRGASTWRTNFPNHERLMPPNYSSHDGVAETIAIASAADLAPVVTHIKSQGHEQGRAEDMLAMMGHATTAGHYTAGDVYPYLAGLTGLGDLLIPGWAQDGGRPKMLERFRDPQLRARIGAETEQAMAARLAGGPAGVYLPVTQEELTAIARKEGVSPGEALVRTLEREDVTAVLRFGVEADLIAFLKSPVISITCDCGATRDTLTHPRQIGTWPRVLGHYVRDEKILSWEEAIRKMTALPASTIGIIDRGLLSMGMAADITVFDPTTITDRATYAQPALPSAGIRYVFVNGYLALRDGTPTGTQGGKLLYRSLHMPTRPMIAGAPAHVLLRSAKLLGSDGASFSLDFDLLQTPHHATTGRLTVRDSQGRVVLTSNAFGRIQRTRGWLSVTAVGRDHALRVRSLSITLDAADEPPSTGTATILLDSDVLGVLTGHTRDIAGLDG